MDNSIRLEFPEEYKLIYAIIRNMVVKKANNARDSAAYNGQFSDNGAEALLNMVNAWTAGLHNAVPSEFKEFIQSAIEEYKAAKNSLEDRYSTYVKLSKEFYPYRKVPSFEDWRKEKLQNIKSEL